MAARRFLVAIAAIIALLIGAGVVWSLFPQQIMRLTFVPSIAFAPPPEAGAPDYSEPDAWLSRPGTPDDPAIWLPPGVPGTPRTDAVVFFVPPGTYLDKRHWNAAYDDRTVDARTRTLVSSQASAFRNVARVWAPRYREATVGALLAAKPDAAHAFDLAYSDVARAFEAFVQQVPPDAPIILAGDSQGSFHLLRILRAKVAGHAVSKRIVAAYLVGWPVSITADLPALGMKPCTEAAQTHCVLSWESFAEPADPAQLRVIYDASRGFAGVPRKGTAALCVNPLTGTQGGAAPASANLGALVPDRGYKTARLVPHLVPARCDPQGLLLIGQPPEGYGVAVLPGNDFHVFDYALFWANIRADAARRLAAYQRHHRG